VNKKFKESLLKGEDTVSKFAKIKEQKVEEPIKIIEDEVERASIPKKYLEVITDAWKEEPDSTYYGIINAFTRAGRNIETNEENIDKRIELEEHAGKLLEKLAVA